MGPNCNEDFDACGSNNCQNGGICQSVENNTHYICQCPVGFSGQMCEENIDDCIGKKHSFNKNNEQNLQWFLKKIFVKLHNFALANSDLLFCRRIRI